MVKIEWWHGCLGKITHGALADVDMAAPRGNIGRWMVEGLWRSVGWWRGWWRSGGCGSHILAGCRCAAGCC